MNWLHHKTEQKGGNACFASCNSNNTESLAYDFHSIGLYDPERRKMCAPLTKSVGCSDRAEYGVHQQEDLSEQTISRFSRSDPGSLQTQSTKSSYNLPWDLGRDAGKRGYAYGRSCDEVIVPSSSGLRRPPTIDPQPDEEQTQHSLGPHHLEDESATNQHSVDKEDLRQRLYFLGPPKTTYCEILQRPS